MKIGLLAFQNANNNGAMFQLFALQYVLESAGADVSVLNYDSSQMQLLEYLLPNYRAFRDKYLHLTEATDNFLSIDFSAYDAIIVGSDQVWNPQLIHNDNSYFLPFKNETTKKIAYAASSGLDDQIKYDLDILCRRYLSDFDKISMRESSLVPFVQQYTTVPVHTCVDPTLLLTSSEYDNIFATEPPLLNIDYILLFYILPDPRLWDFVNMLSLSTNKKIVAITYQESDFCFVNNTIVERSISPEKWLNYIKHASLVITDSFHGIMFSMIFRRPFYVYTYKSPSAIRIMDILRKYNLLDRRLSSLHTVLDTQFNIDYSSLNDTLEKERDLSLSFLLDVFN